ncbi:MAG: hypothetical protein ACTSRE_16185 [Promethearchaeota archaeon]
MRSAEVFFKWAFETRAQRVIALSKGENISMDKLFLSFTSHNPALITHGPAGLNGSIKGIGFVPKQEFMDEVLQKYLEHINSFKPDDKTYSNRGLKLLVNELYSEEAQKRIDFSIITTLELAKNHTWENIQVNKEATYIFYQPPRISFELRGKIKIDDVGIYKKFVNAQHDVYHAPKIEEWENRPALIFHVEEIYDNSAHKDGFGTKLKYPV